MEQLKNGDTCMVIPDIKEHRYFNDPGLTYDMEDLAGTIVTIDYVFDNKPWCKVEENSWCWDTRWLEKVNLEAFEIEENDLLSILGAENEI